jgi:hypothetical protein
MTEELMLIQQADITPTKSQESFERPVRPARAANRVMEDMYSQHQINTPLPYRKAYQSSEEEIITQSSSGSEKVIIYSKKNMYACCCFF